MITLVTFTTGRSAGSEHLLLAPKEAVKTKMQYLKSEVHKKVSSLREYNISNQNQRLRKNLMKLTLLTKIKL